jgi:hypothetical protein|tara:strand:- start:284 stop:454 length:171 start_codon:yes stop_codon:yes gene_type:complete
MMAPFEEAALEIAKARVIEIMTGIGFEKPPLEYTKEQFHNLVKAAVDGYHETGPCL